MLVEYEMNIVQAYYGSCLGPGNGFRTVDRNGLLAQTQPQNIDRRQSAHGLSRALLSSLSFGL